MPGLPAPVFVTGGTLPAAGTPNATVICSTTCQRPWDFANHPTPGGPAGFAFAFGWTPCIGPILSAVLILAARSDTIARGVLLLAVYSAGLAIPFLLTALGIGKFMVFYKNFRKYLHAVELFSGALLLFVGGLVFVNKLTWLSTKLTFLNRFSL